jgi:hypothetical protein
MQGIAARGETQLRASEVQGTFGNGHIQLPNIADIWLAVRWRNPVITSHTVPYQRWHAGPTDLLAAWPMLNEAKGSPCPPTYQPVKAYKTLKRHEYWPDTL